MCYDPDVSKVVLEHHLKKADNLRRQGKKEEARKHLQSQNIHSEHITYKYAHLKNVLEGQPA